MPARGDICDIRHRVLEIDPSYVLVYNARTGKHEIHNADSRWRTTYELTVPFNELDARTLDYVRETQIWNSKKLIAEMEANNARIDAEKQSSAEREMHAASVDLANELRRATL